VDAVEVVGVDVVVDVVVVEVKMEMMFNKN
jgi:hypothetical protein